MRITKSQAIKAGKKLGVDFDVVEPTTLWRGMIVELEHGRRRGISNVTNDNLLMTAKIALAHLEEFPDYYDALEAMEKKLKKKWSTRTKPNIFL